MVPYKVNMPDMQIVPFFTSRGTLASVYWTHLSPTITLFWSPQTEGTISLFISTFSLTVTQPACLSQWVCQTSVLIETSCLNLTLMTS